MEASQSLDQWQVNYDPNKLTLRISVRLYALSLSSYAANFYSSAFNRKLTRLRCFQCGRTFVSPLSVVVERNLLLLAYLCLLIYPHCDSCQRGGLHELYINVLFSLFESRVRVIKLIRLPSLAYMTRLELIDLRSHWLILLRV